MSVGRSKVRLVIEAGSCRFPVTLPLRGPVTASALLGALPALMSALTHSLELHAAREAKQSERAA